MKKRPGKNQAIRMIIIFSLLYGPLFQHLSKYIPQFHIEQTLTTRCLQRSKSNALRKQKPTMIEL